MMFSPKSHDWSLKECLPENSFIFDIQSLKKHNLFAKHI